MFEDLLGKAGLSLDRLRSLTEVDEAQSITQAAKGDPSRQALISRQLRELEEYFGVELTERQGRRLQLSPAGRRLAGLAREHLRDLADFAREQAGTSKTYRLGAGASVLEWLAIPAARGIRQALGNATLQFTTRRSRDLVEAIQEGQLDFAIVREDALPANAMNLTLQRLRFFLCIPRSLLADLGSVPLRDLSKLKSLPVAANAGGGQLDTTFRKAMESILGAFSPDFECDSLLQVRQLIETGACAGVLPCIGLAGLNAKTVHWQEFKPMKDYGRPLVLHWNERHLRRRQVSDSAIREIRKTMLSSASSGR
jgi:DNA-binding transcriptional LysR family regulator